MEIITKSVTTESWTHLVFALSISLLGGYLIFSPNILIFIGIGILGGGLFYLFKTFQTGNVEKNPLIKQLRDHPEEIVWVYSILTQRMPYGFEISKNGIMYFKLLNGDEMTITVREQHIPIVAKMLNKMLPHASFGFTKDREQWYIADPALLLQNTKESDDEND